MEGETFSYTIHSVYGRDQLEISTENQTLSIHKKWNAFPMMLRFGWMDTNQLVITVPKGTVLRSADIKVSMGETVITGLTAESISVENTMGSVKGTLHGKNLTVKTTMGEVNLSGNIAAMELKSVMGSCKVITSQPQEKYTAQTSLRDGGCQHQRSCGVQGWGPLLSPFGARRVRARQQRMEQGNAESLFHERTTTQMKRAKTILFAVFAGLGVLYFLVGLVMLWMGVVSEEGFPMALVFIPLGLVFCGVGLLFWGGRGVHYLVARVRQ